jgi:hypothetical protein
MKEETLEVFTNESNFAVIRLPQRKYPGVLIQGDSLEAIVAELEEAIRLFDDDKEESLGCLKLGLQKLSWRLDAYREVCKVHNIV